MSHFCKLILSGYLSRGDLEALFPNEFGPASLPPLFSMPRPSYCEKQMLFVTFFKEVKKSSDPWLFFGLEGQIREFRTTAVKHFEKRFSIFQKVHSDISQETTRRLDVARSSSTDFSALLSNFAQQRLYLKIPAKNGPTRDVYSVIGDVYQYTATHDVERSVTQTVVKHFGGPDGPGILPLIAQIAKFSRKDVEVDLFRQFMAKDFPLHYFLFYADVRVKCSEITPRDGYARTTYLSTRFGRCEWDRLPKAKRMSYD
jgi:hypothetical protein